MQHRLQRIFPRKVSKRNNCPLVQSNSEVFSTALGSQLHLVNKFCATLLSLHTSFMWIIYLLVPLLKHQVAQQMPIYFPGSSDVAHTFPLVSFITACLQSRAKDLTQLQLKRAAKPILISARIGAGWKLADSYSSTLVHPKGTTWKMVLNRKEIRSYNNSKEHSKALKNQKTTDCSYFSFLLSLTAIFYLS